MSKLNPAKAGSNEIQSSNDKIKQRLFGIEIILAFLWYLPACGRQGF
jgi:hypothetical protein